MVTWNDIELLSAIMNAGTLSGAGRSMHVDQTTVARRLRRLEEVLGLALFERQDGKLVPTTQLLQAEEAIKSMANASSLAGAILESSKADLSGRVSVSCLGYYATSFLAPNLNLLLERHPKIELEILVEDRLASFSRREADIAVRLAWPEDSIAVMRRLSTMTFRRYRAKSAHASDPPILQYTDMLSHLPEMILMRKLRPHARPILRADRFDLLSNAAASIGGETMLPEQIGDRDSRFFKVDRDEVSAERPVVLLVHPERRKDLSVAAVKDWIVDLHRC